MRSQGTLINIITASAIRNQLISGGGEKCGRRDWKKMRKNAEKMRKMREKMRHKMRFC